MDRIVENLSKTWPIIVSLIGFLLYISSTRGDLETYMQTHNKETELMKQQTDYVRELTVSNKRMIDILSEKTSLDHDAILRLQGEIEAVKIKVYNKISSSN